MFLKFYVKYGVLKPILRNEFFFPDDDDSTIQVWYNLEIHIYPGKPVNIIEIKCVAMVRAH